MVGSEKKKKKLKVSGMFWHMTQVIVGLALTHKANQLNIGN